MESAAVFSSKLYESFAWYDRASCCWRTYERSLLQGGECLRYLVSWPRAGTMRNGIAYRRAPSAPLTRGTGVGLLPTPTTDTAARTKPYAQGGTPLDYALRMLPTPQARDHFPPHSLEYIAEKRAQGHGMGNLNDYLAHNTLPTPRARDWRSGKVSASTHGKNSRPLNETVSAMAGNRSGRMNPRFREWMMGFPIGWTGLRPPATPSSPASSNSSGAE